MTYLLQVQFIKKCKSNEYSFSGEDALIFFILLITWTTFRQHKTAMAFSLMDTLSWLYCSICKYIKVFIMQALYYRNWYIYNGPSYVIILLMFWTSLTSMRLHVIINCTGSTEFIISRFLEPVLCLGESRMYTWLSSCSY